MSAGAPITEAFVAILPTIDPAAFSAEVETSVESAVSRVGGKAFAPLEAQAAKAGERAGVALDESFSKASSGLTAGAAKAGEKAGLALDASFAKAVAPLGKEAAAAGAKAEAVGKGAAKGSKSGLVGLAALAGGYELVKGSIEKAQQRQLDQIRTTEVFGKTALPSVSKAIEEVSRKTIQTIETTTEGVNTVGQALQAVGVTQKQSASLSEQLVQRVGDVAAKTGKDVNTLIAGVQTSLASGSTRALRSLNVVADNSDIAFTAAKAGIVQLTGTSKDLASAQGSLVKLQSSLTDAQEQYGKKSTQAQAIQTKIAYQQTVIGNLQKANGSTQRQQLSDVLGLQSKVTKSQDAYKAAVDKYGESSKQAQKAQKKYNSANSDFLALVKTAVPSLTKQQKALALTHLILDKTTNGQGAAEKRSHTFSGAVQTLKVAFANLEEEIGVKIIPILTKAANVLTAVLGFMDRHKTTVKVITTLFALLGGVLLAYKTALLVAAAAEKVMEVQTAILNAIIDANPITLVVVALVALAAGLVLAYKHSKTFRDIVDKIGKVLKAVLLPVLHLVVAAFDFVRDHIKLVGLILLTLTGPIGIAIALFIKFHDQIIAVLKSVYDAVKSFIEAVISFFVALPGNIVKALSSLGKLLADVFTKLGQLIYLLIQKYIQLWLDVYIKFPLAVLRVLAGLAGKVANVFVQVGRAALAAVTTWVGSIVHEIAGLPGKITALAGKMLSAGKTLIGHFVDGLKTIGGKAGGIADTIGHAIVGVVNHLVIDPLNTALAFISDKIGKLPFVSNPHLHIPSLANGGVFDKATLALIGEAGKEVAIPLTRPRRAMELATQSGLLDLLVAQANRESRGSLANVTNSRSNSRTTTNHNTFVLPAADPQQHAEMVGHRLASWSDR